MKEYNKPILEVKILFTERILSTTVSGLNKVDEVFGFESEPDEFF